ncbi:MAG: hypothetical protein H0T78_05220 [Longispora sp.]|nr:hypothetical protein [Longispora sp. (in: high G+C Gram-positive bacteria)]
MAPAPRERDLPRGELALAVYSHLHRHGTHTFEHAVQSLGLESDEVSAARDELLRLGLITSENSDSHVAILPESAVIKALEVGQRRLTEYRGAIADVHGTLDEIVNRYMPLGSSRNEEVTLSVLRDQRRINGYLDAMTSLAREEVLTMHPGPPPPLESLTESLDRDLHLAERGLRLRTIYLRSLAATGYVNDHLRTLESYGYEVRLAALLPVRMLIFDRRRALMPLNPTSIRSGAVVIESETFVQSLAGFFDYCWQNSSPLSATDETDAQSGLTEHDQAVLRMLASGAKDEAIARGLGVSVRTVSRTVGELTHRLGAESRFQAGVRAAQRGWLD